MEKLMLSIYKANNYLLNESSIDDALNLCIREIGFNQELDRCYIIKNKVINGVLRPYYAYEWCNKGIESYSDTPDLKGISYDALPKFYHKLSLDQPIFGLIKEVDNESFRELMKIKNIKSYLFVPIFFDNSFWGFIGYDDCQNERRWSEEEVNAMHIIAKNIGLRLNQYNTTLQLENTVDKIDLYMASTNQAIWEVDLDKKKSFFSYNWMNILGFSSDEIATKNQFFRKRIHPNDLSQILIDLEDFIKGNLKEFKGVTRIMHKDGHYVWVKFSGLLKKNIDGISKKIIGTAIDVSELKNRERQLAISEAKYKFMVGHTTDLICQHSKDGNILYVSDFSNDIIGYTFEELIHKCPSDFIHKRDLIDIKKYYQSIIKNKQNDETIIYRLRRKDDSYLWLETSIKVMLDNDKQVIGFQSSSRDITKKIMADREMKNAFLKERKFNELKSKFVSIASHQFRTPLTVIYSNAELLELKTNHFEKSESDEFRMIISRIKNEVERMTELMNNILVFGKQEAKKIEKTIQPIDFNDFIQTLTETYFYNDNIERKIQLQTIGEKKVFHTDESLLVHILTNVISNAFKYSVGKQDPELIITYLEKVIEIQVIDYGLGIPKKDIPNLFTSFFRASNTHSIIGSGLGLVIVKQFTEFLNGTIELKTKENFGTTIKLTFPYEQ